MLRKLGLPTSLFLLLLASCNTMTPAGQATLDCANALDGSAFGFSLSVPSDLTCTSVFPNPIAVALVGYRQEATDRLVSVQVNRPQQDPGQTGDGVNIQQGDSYTNANNITFALFRSELLGRVVYGAGTPLPSGNNLFVTVAGTEAPESPALRQAILDTVVVTP